MLIIKGPEEGQGEDTTDILGIRMTLQTIMERLTKVESKVDRLKGG